MNNQNDIRKKRELPLILRILFVFLTFIGVILLLAVGACFILLKGPSEKAARLFTLSCNETSAMKWVPGLFLPEETVHSILFPDETVTPEDGTYHIRIVGDSINVSFVTSEEEQLLDLSPYDSTGALNTGSISFEGSENNINSEAGNLLSDSSASSVYELIDLQEGTYKGKILLVHDPSKVQIASIPSFGGAGWTLSQFIEEYDALACTNAGGFEDENGKGKGGIPDGIVIRDGSIVYGDSGSYYKDVVGFDSNHVLHVGNMTGGQALSVGIIDGMSFSLGPVLIQDGVRQTGFNSGINPRSAIGQSADGTVILIAIEGRMLDSLGATFEDVADIMERYGAINAANLDGGSSSGMYYEGERITRSCSVVGDRPLPTAIIVNR